MCDVTTGRDCGCDIIQAHITSLLCDGKCDIMQAHVTSLMDM